MTQSFTKDGVLGTALSPDASMVEDDDHNEGAPDLSCLIRFLCGVEHNFHGYSRHFPNHQPLHDKVSLQGWKVIVNSVAHIAELLASHAHYLLSRDETTQLEIHHVLQVPTVRIFLTASFLLFLTCDSHFRTRVFCSDSNFTTGMSLLTDCCLVECPY